MPLLLVLWTGLLVAFYDLAGKYLVALGLLSLGLIRFFHAVIPAPQLPLLVTDLTRTSLTDDPATADYQLRRVHR